MSLQTVGSALTLLKAFLSADLEQRDAEKALSFLSRDIWWYGTGADEDVHGIAEAEQYFQREMESAPSAYQVEYLSCVDQTQADGTGAAHVKCHITGCGITLLCRCSAFIRPEDGKFKIYALHMSVPDSIQQDGEYFPFSLAEQYERELHQEFLNDMIEGGILGRYDDPSSEIFIVNRQLLGFLGYPSEEAFRAALNNCAANLIHPENRDAIARSTAAQLARNKRYLVEYRMIRRDGSTIWVESRGKAVLTKSGRTALVGIINDISARKNAELLVKAQNQEIRNLYDIIPGGVFICKFNPDWDVTFANEGFYSFLGYTRQEFTQLFHDKMAGVIYKDDLTNMMSTTQAQLANSNYVENINRLVCKGGTVKWISIHALLCRSQEGAEHFYCTFVDITGQKEAEQKLRENEERYRIAIEGAGITVWEYDIQNHRVILPQDSPRADGEMLVFENFPDSVADKLGISPKQFDELKGMLHSMECGASKVSGDFWVTSPQTHSRWCERVTYSVAFDQEGRPVTGYGVSMDVTQSKLAEKRYQEELTYRDQVVDSVVATCCVNLNTRKVESMRIVGQPVPVQIDRDLFDCRKRTLAFLVDNEMSDAQNERLSPDGLIRSYDEGNTAVSEEYLARIKENRYCWIRVDVNLVKHPESGDILAFFYNRDLTDDLIRLNIMNTVLTKDYEEVGVVDFRTGFYKRNAGNEALSQAGGECRYSDNIERFCTSCVAEQDRARMVKLLQLPYLEKMIQKHHIYEVQFLGLSRTGQRRFFLMRFQYLGSSCNIMLITRQDIDDVVKKEQQKQRQLEQAVATANQASQIKSQFLSRMSHEIRTPLNAIIGLAALGQKNLARPEPNLDDARDYVLKILDSSHYLLSIINDILDMSKIESSKITLSCQVMDCPHVLSSIDTIIGTQAAAKNVRFKIRQQVKCPEHMLGDVTRVEQVLINLLGNAVKFTPEGGEVSLTIDKRWENRDQVCLEFVVADTGVGISEEFLPHLFKPFTQENAEITSAYGGSGLGLAIARQLTRLMNGDLTVKSQKGKGSVFTAVMCFSIQHTSSDAGDESPPAGKSYSSLRNRKILVCEDHPLNTIVVKRMLEQLDCTVDTAANGKLGMDAFRSSKLWEYDAVLMDIRMPVMGGLSAAAAIRASKRADAKKIPIIAMTANAYEEDIRLSRNAGMNAHLVKPIEPDPLYETLAELCRKEKGQDVK
ncbi:MAG: ATP-binding protein [Oscillospiraceae bacterium]|jgi:PAS domain S-box-containing protein